MYIFNKFLYCFCTLIAAVFAEGQASGSYCEITNKDYQLSYNFSRLSDPFKDTVITRDYLNETVKIRLCSVLRDKCDGKDGYAVCLVKNKEERGIGRTPPKVTKEPGKVIFLFSGDGCAAGANYTMSVIMKCDYLATNDTRPELFSHTDEQCNLFMIWRTVEACRPADRINCTVEENGLHYDLSPLTRYSDNYVIHMDNPRSPSIILNVCRSVIFEYGALCPQKSAACLRAPPQPPKLHYPNLGEVSAPFMENGQLKIRYKDGDICQAQKPADHISTTITFLCDLEAIDTVPEYVRGKEECHYQLIWRTVAACSVESLRNRSLSTAGKCAVTSPLSNFTYNLQALIGQDYDVATEGGNKYKLGICGQVADTGCKPGTGVCLAKNGTSMGLVNTNLMWQEGGPYLNYTNGDTCGVDGQQRRYTMIAFVCGPKGSSGVPLVMEESGCRLIIHWHTDLVCERHVKCATNDDEIDLSPLISTTKSYMVTGPGNAQFYINVCRPLIPRPGLTCAHGSAVCKATPGPGDRFLNKTSLGFPRDGPTMEGRVPVLRYFGGSPCPEDPSRMLSSSFAFPCDQRNKGSPVYKGYENCTYMFEWRTSITCSAVIGNWSSPCKIRDQTPSRECDLSTLYKAQPAYRVTNRQGKEYTISICEDRGQCNGSAVCQSGNSYGTLGNVVFDYGKDLIKLQYLNGSKCNNSSYTAKVWFICNESIGHGQPKLRWESQCTAEFEWRTNATCRCELDDSRKLDDRDSAGLSGNDPGNGLGFSTGHAATVAGSVLTVVTAIALFLYLRDPSKRAGLRSCLLALGSRRHGNRVQYCRVNTQEEVRLLLDADPTQCQTDSDDDLLNA